MYHNQNFFLLLAFISLQSSSIFASLYGNRLLFPVDYSQITVQQNQNFQPDFSKVSYFKKNLKLNEQQKLYHHVNRLIQSDRFVDMIDASLPSNFHDFNNLLDSDIDDYLQCVNGKSDVEFIDYLAQEYPLYKKSLPIDDQQITVNFKPKIVTQDTVFDYPHYQLGFDLAGLNFQDFMTKRLIGKNLHDYMQDSQGNLKTLLDNTLDIAENIIIGAHKDRFQKILLDMINRNIPDDEITDQSFNYIKEYAHALDFDICLYVWQLFEAGCQLQGSHFKEVLKQESAYFYLMLFCKDHVCIDSTAQIVFDEKGNVRTEFKQALRSVQGVRILNSGAEHVFIREIKNSIQKNKNFSESQSQVLTYFLQYKDVDFIKKALNLWFDNNRDEIILKAIKTDNAQIFKDIIELGNFDIHQVYYYDYEYRNMFQCAVDLDKNNIVTYLIQNTEQKDLLQLLRTAIEYRLYESIQGSPFKAIKILLDAGVDIDFVYEDGNKVMDYIRDFEEFGSHPIKTLLMQASQRKALQDIEHVWTIKEKEIQERLQQGFDLLGLNYHDFFNEQLAGRHLDESVQDDGLTVLDYIFNQAEQKIMDDISLPFFMALQHAHDNNIHIDQIEDPMFAYIFKSKDFSLYEPIKMVKNDDQNIDMKIVGIKYLIKEGCDVHVQLQWGRSILGICLGKGQSSPILLSCLIAVGADVDQIDDYGDNILDLMSQEGEINRSCWNILVAASHHGNYIVIV